jgi:hypothetical protein
VERSHWHFCLVRPFCFGLWCARDARPDPWDPLGEIFCGGGRAPVAALRRRRHPRRDSPRGPTARAELRRRRSQRTALHDDRRVGKVRAPHPPVPATATRPAVAPLRRRSARIRPVDACAARTDSHCGEHERGLTVPRVARSARGRPAAASAWAPRSRGSAPMPDRTRSKRRRGAPRCRTSVHEGPSPKQPRTSNSASR